MNISDIKYGFGLTIRTCRERRGLTKVELARVAGVSVDFIQRLEEGDAQFNRKLFYKVAFSMRLSFEEKSVACPLIKFLAVVRQIRWNKAKRLARRRQFAQQVRACELAKKI